MSSNLDNLSLVHKIDVDHNHIDNFVLETTEGTKRTKAKFHREASEQRNTYINNQLSIYQRALVEIRSEMAKRFDRLMPKDNGTQYTGELLKVDNLLNLVKLNSDISNCFKLKLDFIVASITNDTSLQNLNYTIESFISRMKKIGIVLTVKDFSYTMFTEMYMDTFFAEKDFVILKDSFEKIYFACPDIKLQLKMNLEYILGKYEKELDKYVLSLKEEEFKKFNVTDDTVVDKYVQIRKEIGSKIAMDEFYNTKLFLDGNRKLSDYLPDSPARSKNFDMFCMGGNYESLEATEKDHYNSAAMGLFLTLNELKKYYRYEFIITDLLNRYKEKDSVKSSYLAKKKEIDKEEGARQGIYKDYLKACGIGFLAKKNEEKMQDARLKMNEQVRKLRDLYAEFKDMEITYLLSSLSESATIYDLFLTALKSFPFLEKSFTSDEEFLEKSLEENVGEFFRFLYNPNNNFLRKINALADYNVTDVVAEKYKLLNLNVTSEMINVDNIDATLDSVRFINLIQNVNNSKIDFHTIDNLYKINNILKENQE